MKCLSTLLTCLALLTACSNAPVSQFAISGEPIEQARKSSTTIEVFEVSLPLYMQAQEIPVMGSDGAIKSNAQALWADEPSRSISLHLAEALSRLSGGIASVEPWPLEDPARQQLDVRVKTLLATVGGELRFSGQYFLVSDTGNRPKVEWFDISVPLVKLTGTSIAQATGAATQQLARQILGK